MEFVRSLTRFTLTITALLLLLICDRSPAQIEEFVPKPVEDSSLARNGLMITYQRFVGAEMKKVYGGTLGIHAGRMMWSWNPFGIRVCAGVVGTEGTPIVIDKTVPIYQADIAFWALDLEASLVYHFTDGNPVKDVTPFVGIGVDAFGATEKLTVALTRDTVFTRGDGSALRGTVAGHAIVGIFIPIGLQNSLQIEAKGMYSLSTGYRDLLSEDQEQVFKQNIYTVVKRPKFDMTGITLGLAIFF